jgi:DNA-binding beta-propeller fold protein YncE
MIIGSGIRIGAGIQLIAVTSTAWDLAFATFNGTNFGIFSVVDRESLPTGLFFKPDGTKMYVVGSSSDRVQEYDLGRDWDVATATYLQNVNIITQESSPTALHFKPDGTKMFVLGNAGDDVNEYDLSTAWNVTTASYVQNVSVAAQEITPQGLFFKPDGTKMYVIGTSGDDVNEYDLSTAWNVATASYLQNVSVAAQESGPNDLFFKPDGTKMYVIGTVGDDVNEYNLSSAWNVATASYVQNVSVAAQEITPEGLFFRDDGIKMYVLGNTGDDVNEYDLSSAWNVATASLSVPVQNYFSVQAQEANPTGLFFKPDGTKMYVVGTTGDDVNEYNLNIAWDITTATYLQNVSIAAQEITPQAVFFKPDGTKMYVMGQTGDDVNEYDLSTAWNVATATFVQIFSVAGQEINPSGLHFKPDGTKMYVIGTSGDDVNEYNLSSAWNVATATFVQVFSVQAQERVPTGLFFKDDGTKMFVVGTVGIAVNEYDLSSAWNVASAAYSKAFSVAAQDTSPQDIFFKPDGTKMYVIGQTYNAVWAYDL